MKRRDFLQKGILATSCALFPQRVLGLATEGTQPHLIFVLLQGGADLLAFLPPVEDPAYPVFRPRIGLSSKVNRDHKIASPFYLHPRAASLYPLWKNGELAFVLQTGFQGQNSSHSLAQDELQLGAPGNRKISDGFLFRTLNEMKLDPTIRAIALQPVVPTSLFGAGPGILCFDKLSKFSFDPFLDTSALRSLYGKSTGTQGNAAMNSAFAAMERLRPMGKDPGYQDFVRRFPEEPFGRKLGEVGWLIKHRLGTPIFAVTMDGWDTHVHQGADTGASADLIGNLSDGISALRENLGADWERTLVVAMTEFGRTVEENGSQGTEHGKGSLSILAGGRVRGGRLYGTWKDLKKENLVADRYLPVTTDYRQILAECLVKHLKLEAPGGMARIFPGFDYLPEKNLALLS